LGITGLKVLVVVVVSTLAVMVGTALVVETILHWKQNNVR
jgi:putative effector of murein hydrolase LrgA (UPF0299 family)